METAVWTSLSRTLAIKKSKKWRRDTMYGYANAVSDPVGAKLMIQDTGNSPSNKLKQGILLSRETDVSFIYMHTKNL